MEAPETHNRTISDFPQFFQFSSEMQPFDRLYKTKVHVAVGKHGKTKAPAEVTVQETISRGSWTSVVYLDPDVCQTSSSYLAGVDTSPGRDQEADLTHRDSLRLELRGLRQENNCLRPEGFNQKGTIAEAVN